MRGKPNEQLRTKSPSCNVVLSCIRAFYLVICMFLDHGIAAYRTRTLKGSLKFIYGNRTGPCGPNIGLGTPVRLCMRAMCESVRMPYTGLGISV